MCLEDKIKSFRYAPIDRRSTKPGDKFLGMWIYVKTFAMQGLRRSQIRQCENYLQKFFASDILAETIASDPDSAWQIIAEQCYDSAALFIKTCLEDRNYGSKLFNLVPLKADELAMKISSDRDAIVAILNACDLECCDMLICSYQRAYADIMKD